MSKKILAFGLSLFIVTLLVLPTFVLAQGNVGTNDVLGINYGASTGLGSRDIRDTVGSIINVALGLLGIVAVVIVLIGGFEWMTAGGNEEQTSKAKQRILAGVIGLAIILSAYAISRFVVGSLVNATK
jgi:hypothetical protein